MKNIKKLVLNILLVICTVIVLTTFGKYSQPLKDDQNNVNESSILSDELNWEWFIEPGEYINIQLFEENFIGVENHSGEYGIINKSRDLIVDYKYFNILGVRDSIARVLDFDRNYLFVDNKGIIISNILFSEVNDFSEGLAAVKNNGKWGFINIDGDLVIDYQFDDVANGFSEGFIAVEKNKKWGFINKNGEIVIECKYDFAENFYESCAGVKKNNKWGFIDTNGKLLIDFKYDDIGNFSEGKVAVKDFIDGVDQWAYINKNN